MKERPYIQRIKELNLLDGKGFALNVGSREGFDSLKLKDLGYSVEAIDKINHPAVEGILFTHADIIDFPVQKEKYNFILCRNILPFIKDKQKVSAVLAKLVDGLVYGGIIYFTLFGPNDEWASDPKMSFYSYDDAIAEVGKLPLEIVERSHMEGPTTTINGKLKHSEAHRFICRKK